MEARLSNREHCDIEWLDETLNLSQRRPYEFRRYGSPGIVRTQLVFGPWPTAGVQWAATLGARRIFLMVSDLSIDQVGAFLAYVVHLDRRDISVERQLSLRLGHPLLARNGWEAVCFLDPADIPGYPGRAVRDADDRMLWTLPITRAEHETRNRDGVCAMLDQMARSGRNVLRLCRGAKSSVVVPLGVTGTE